MSDFTITERTEPFTLDEVFSFIDDTKIGKKDVHELKSRIVDVVHAERNKAIDEFAKRLKETLPIAVHRDCSEIDYEVDYALYNMRHKIDEIAKEMRGAE